MLGAGSAIARSPKKRTLNLHPQSSGIRSRMEAFAAFICASGAPRSLRSLRSLARYPSITIRTWPCVGRVCTLGATAELFAVHHRRTVDAGPVHLTVLRATGKHLNAYRCAWMVNSRMPNPKCTPNLPGERAAHRAAGPRVRLAGRSLSSSHFAICHRAREFGESCYIFGRRF